MAITYWHDYCHSGHDNGHLWPLSLPFMAIAIAIMAIAICHLWPFIIAMIIAIMAMIMDMYGHYHCQLWPLALP